MRGFRLRVQLAFILLVMLILLTTAPLHLGCSQEEQEVTPDRDTLYQVSTLGALKEGFYDGDITYTELAGHGDFGIGTFEGLDGEMIALDGSFYQVKTDGKVYEVDGGSIAPFAMLTFFDEDSEARPPQGLDYAGLMDFIDGILPSENIFYAVKLEGAFEHVKARSVPAQSKPYPPLNDVVAEQTVFEFNDVEGTMVGFWCPSYVGDINAPGYHLHFITADGRAGGHVLDLRLGEVTLFLDDTLDLRMQLPHMEEFLEADLEPALELDN